ncbi:MAG: LysR family transcriptional regulator [Rhodocyclales bacterium]|nr:LysR family transcriptional regulator [Rhodocyclales bacterium]
MSRAEEITAFALAVETGGFSAAARKLGLTPSALSKLIGRLEDRLGSRLLHRTTRRLKLTSEGEVFYARIRPILTALDEAENEVSEAAATPRGQLRLRCGIAFGMHQLTHAIPRFLARYPDISLDLTFSDQPAPQAEESFDLALRFGIPDEMTAVVRHICNVGRVICAAPAYLERYGTPRTPDDLQRHNCLWITSLPALRRWPFDTDEGIRVVHIDGNVVANNGETVLQLALAGVGITRLTDVTVGSALASGALVPILTDWHHVEPVPLVATYSSGRHLTAKVRAMIDFLVEEFAHRPWLQRNA